MSRILFKIGLSAAVLFAAAGAASAQQEFGPQWGETPEQQQHNVMYYNFFRDAYNNNSFDEAASYLPDLLNGAPQATQNLYIYAIRVFDNRILRATSVAQKNERIDSLMLIYDLRLKNFGDKPESSPARVLPLKAQSYLDYKPTDRAGVRKVFNEAIDVLGDNADPNFINLYFNELTNDYQNAEIEADEYMAEYERFEATMLNAVGTENESARNTFEALFLKSGVANCDNLEQMFGPKFEANPDDLEMVRKAAQQMSRAKCESELFARIAEQFYKLEPSSATALIVANIFEKQKNYNKSLEYLRAAIQSETDPAEKVKLSIRISASELGAGNSRTAAEFAKQAIAIDNENGLAYYFLAQAYANGVNGCSGFDRQAAFWLVYDALAQAKRFLKPEDGVKDIDSQMGSYRASFPDSKECFFRGLQAGQSHHVSCGWVSGSTTVRPR